MAILTDSKAIGILVCGGENSTEQTQTICYNHILGSKTWEQFPHELRKPRKGACITQEGNIVKVTGGVKMDRNPYLSRCSYRHSPIGVIKSSEVLDLNNITGGWQLKEEDDIPTKCNNFICYGPSRIGIPCIS